MSAMKSILKDIYIYICIYLDFFQDQLPHTNQADSPYLAQKGHLSAKVVVAFGDVGTGEASFGDQKSSVDGAITGYFRHRFIRPM